MHVQVQNPEDVYEVVCFNIHVNRFRVHNHRSTLLYEAGIQALEAGYYREAVVNFAASLERYLELSIQALLHSSAYRFEKPVNRNEFDKVWKFMSKQSERQIGAFWMVYFTCLNESPPAFDKAFLKQFNLNLGMEGNDPIEFRNAITHKGSFPTYNQAVSYGEAVYRYMMRIIEGGLSLTKSYLYNISLLQGPASSLAFMYGFAPIDAISEPHLPIWQLPTFLDLFKPTEERFNGIIEYKSLFNLFPLKP